MTRPNPIPHIKAVRPQAIADEGDTIVFEIETADGGRQSFGVVTGLLSPIVTVLQQLGAEADAYRNRRPEEFKRDEVVVPYLLRSAKVGMAGDGSRRAGRHSGYGPYSERPWVEHVSLDRRSTGWTHSSAASTGCPVYVPRWGGCRANGLDRRDADHHKIHLGKDILLGVVI